MITRALSAAGLLALLASAFAFKAAARMPDFEVYWRAGARASVAEPLYRDEDEHYQFKYLPAFAILVIPAALLPLPVAKALWFTASVALLGVLLALSLMLLPSRRKPPWLLVALTVVAMAKFYGHELVLGQVNILFTTVVLIAVHLLLRGRDAGAGLLVALAVVIKPYAVIFLPWLVARRSMRALLGWGAGITLALLLPAAVYGFDGTRSLHRAWWRTVTDSTGPNLLNADNVSLAAMYAKWMGPGPPATWLAVVSAVVLLLVAAIVLLLRRRAAAPDGLEAALLLTLIPLLSPQGWDYVFLGSTPAVMYLVNYHGDLPPLIRVAAVAALATIAFSLYDVMGRQAYSAFMALSVISVCYLVVVGALSTLRVRGAA